MAENRVTTVLAEVLSSGGQSQALTTIVVAEVLSSIAEAAPPSSGGTRPVVIAIEPEGKTVPRNVLTLGARHAGDLQRACDRRDLLAGRPAAGGVLARVAPVPAGLTWLAIEVVE